MNLYLFLLNSKQYKVHEREAYYFKDDQLVTKFKVLKKKSIIDEIVFLNTCYRIEYYVVSYLSLEELSYFVFEEKFSNGIQVYQSYEVIHRLFRLVSGLDSPIIGENEIFFQVKKAYQNSFAYKLTGKFLNKIFQKSFYVGKKIRTETQIASHSLSIFGLVLNEIKSFNTKPLKDLSMLLIGGGELARSLAMSFVKKGIFNITISNQKTENTKSFAESLNYKYLPFKKLKEGYLNSFEIIISCMGNAFFTFDQEDFQVDAKKDIEKISANHMIMVFDLAMPRNFNSNIENCSFIRLLNIDELLNISVSNYELRKTQIEEADRLIKKELDSLNFLKHSIL